MTSVAAPKQGSLFEDIFDVFYAPAAVFERRRNAGFGVALLIYIIVSSLMFWAAKPVMQPMIDKQISQQVDKLQQNPNLSAEQKESMGSKMRGMADSPLAMIGPVVGFPIALFLAALVLWLSGKMFGSAASYGQAAMVTTFGVFPRLLLMVLLFGFHIATGREVSSQFALTLSPAAFLGDDASPVLGALLSRFDLGVLWHTALLGIGLAVVGRIPRGKAFTAAFLTWFVATLFAVASAWRAMA